MATSTIKPKLGTTKQWTDSARVLEVNEWGVEVTEAGTYILRIGDGEHSFMELPRVMDVGAVEKALTTVENFTGTMSGAAAAATTAAQKADTATAAANAAAAACQKLEKGINSMSDAATGKTYTIGVNAGKIYLEEV